MTDRTALSTGPDLTHHAAAHRLSTLLAARATTSRWPVNSARWPNTRLAHILGALAGAEPDRRSAPFTRSSRSWWRSDWRALSHHPAHAGDGRAAKSRPVWWHCCLSPRAICWVRSRMRLFAQVIAETFVVAAWWATTVWDQRPAWQLALAIGLLAQPSFSCGRSTQDPPLSLRFLVAGPADRVDDRATREAWARDVRARWPSSQV